LLLVLALLLLVHPVQQMEAGQRKLLELEYQEHGIDQPPY
jgi:hypothetical protein